MHNLKISYLFLWPLLLLEPSDATKCRADYGQPVDFKSGCTVIELPDFEIEYKSAGRPDPEVPMFCKNYEVRDEHETVTYSACTTGVRGGHGFFVISGRRYAVDRDFPVKCVDGRWLTGLRIWKETPDLPPYGERVLGVPRTIKCEE